MPCHNAVEDEMIIHGQFPLKYRKKKIDWQTCTVSFNLLPLVCLSDFSLRPKFTQFPATIFLSSLMSFSDVLSQLRDEKVVERDVSSFAAKEWYAFGVIHEQRVNAP